MARASAHETVCAPAHKTLDVLQIGDRMPDGTVFAAHDTAGFEMFDRSHHKCSIWRVQPGRMSHRY
jgi:hypothetical protein